MGPPKTRRKRLSSKRPREGITESASPFYALSPPPDIVTPTPKKRRQSDKKGKEHASQVFRPGHTIRFLPERCRIIMLDPPHLDFTGAAPEAIPAWEAPGIPTQKVGMLVDTSPSCPDESLYMRQTLTAPHYEYVDAEGNIIVDGSFRFDPAWQKKENRLRCALLLTMNRASELQKRALDFVGRMRTWREERRAWELNVVRAEFSKGNLGIFCAGFGWKDIADAAAFVMGENERDRKGQIDACDVGMEGVGWGTSSGSTNDGQAGVSFAGVGEVMEKLKLAQRKLEERIAEGK